MFYEILSIVFLITVILGCAFELWVRKQFKKNEKDENPFDHLR